MPWLLAVNFVVLPVPGPSFLAPAVRARDVHSHGLDECESWHRSPVLLMSGRGASSIERAMCCTVVPEMVDGVVMSPLGEPEC